MAGPYYVDNANGNDQDIAIAGDGAYTHASKTLVKVNAFANAAVGYLIDLTGGTNITPGLYQIATNADADTVTLVTAPGTGDVADVTVDSNDGLSEAQAFASLCKAADMVNDGEIVYVQAGTSYVTQDEANDCVLYVDDAGANTAPIVWQGYVSTVGDGGVVTIDANTNTLASTVKTAISGHVYNVFKNFEFKGSSGIGFDGNSKDDDNIVFKNCRFTGNGTHGCYVDNECIFVNCSFDNNGTTTGHHGLYCDLYNYVIGFVAYTNAGRGLYMNQYASAIFGLAYNNGDIDALDLIGIGQVINCTTDGENQASAIGVRQDLTNHAIIIVNTILHDCNQGIRSDGDVGERSVGRNNLFNSNTADVSNFLTPNTDTVGSEVGESQDDVTDTPDFTNEGADDYTIAAAGNPLAAGFDAKYVDDFWDSFIGATNPPSP